MKCLGHTVEWSIEYFMATKFIASARTVACGITIKYTLYSDELISVM